MKTLISFLSVLLCIAPFGVANAVVSSTAGNNLTAYNGEAGAINNNRWNTLMNARTGGTNATADFGNCNALIMRCAQPKCSNGGCTDLSVTSAIVSGCVQSNASCKQYGNELVQYIAAQLVAQSTAKANEANAAAQTAAANAAAQQSAQQMAAMQAQMQQMQAEMAAQNAQTVAQLQSALEEQKQLTANAIAEAQTTQQVAAVAQPVQQSNSGNGLTDAQLTAAQNGVSADVLAREQITGQIMSAIENAEVQLKTLKATMNDVFTYAGCDSRGNNCTGPKRVKMFKQKAEDFFDPYENVLDELYDALILAQSVGVDITDIYMMLNGTCNAWAQYLCTDGQVMHYTNLNCRDGKSLDVYQDGKGKAVYTGLRGGANCVVGQVVPMSDGGCQIVKMLANKEEVQRNWLYPEDGDDAHVRVGCASEALDNSQLFRNRKKQANIDIETLRRIIEQDAPTTVRSQDTSGREQLKYCKVSTLGNLERMVSMKKLPDKVCVSEAYLNTEIAKSGDMMMAYDETTMSTTNHASRITAKCMDWENIKTRLGVRNYYSFNECICEEGDELATFFTNDGICECPEGESTWNPTKLICE